MGGFFILYVVSLILTMGCSDWFLIWLGLEINMMSFIVLVYDRSSSSVETCMKYFFIQSLGSGVLVMMFFSDFYWIEYISLSVLSYKMGGGPFYFWFPVICDNMSWGSIFFLMTVQKILPLLLVTFLVSMFLWVIIIISITMGGAGSFNQKSMKRLMAYSSVHHIGWMLAGNFLGEKLCLIYLAMYSLMIMGVVYSLWKDKILDTGKLGKISSKWSFVLGMLSMGGMPPLLGFFLKWWLFYNLLWVDTSILILMIFVSVLMFYVYLRIVYSVIMGGMKMNSWKVDNKGDKMFSLELFYILGVNVGVFTWFVM